MPSLYPIWWNLLNKSQKTGFPGKKNMSFWGILRSILLNSFMNISNFILHFPSDSKQLDELLLLMSDDSLCFSFIFCVRIYEMLGD